MRKKKGIHSPRQLQTLYRELSGWIWWYVPVLPAVGKLRWVIQEASDVSIQNDLRLCRLMMPATCNLQPIKLAMQPSARFLSSVRQKEQADCF